MHCPYCGAPNTRVVDSRLKGEGAEIRRRRECGHCNARFSTAETAELKLPNVVKSDGNRVAFEVEKLRAGMLKALEKRPVGTEAVEQAVRRIVNALRGLDASEVAARDIGEQVMNELSRLDQVAYVRFASVYRRFEDVQAFREEVERLEQDALGGLDSRQLSLLGRGRADDKDRSDG